MIHCYSPGKSSWPILTFGQSSFSPLGTELIGNPAKEITCHLTSPLTGIMWNVSIIIRAEQLFKTLHYTKQLACKCIWLSRYDYDYNSFILIHPGREARHKGALIICAGKRFLWRKLGMFLLELELHNVLNGSVSDREACLENFWWLGLGNIP